MSQTTDYIAQWYEVREEMGIPDTIHLFFHNLSNQQQEWQQHRHRDMDGIGMIANTLEGMGYQFPLLPTCRDKCEPELLSVWKQQRQLPRDKAPKQVQWKYFRHQRDVVSSEPVVDIIEPALLEHLKDCASMRQVSLASLLLACLNRAAFELLLKPDSTAYWFYPVNVRDQHQGSNDRGNRSSGFYLPVNHDSSAESIHQQVRQRLRSQQHWWLWKQAHIGRLVGKTGVRWIYKTLSRKQHYLGSFSFLGDWSMPQHPQLVLGVCGAGTENYPIATGITECNQHLSLALKFHPSICRDEQTSARCLQRWVAILKEESAYE